MVANSILFAPQRATRVKRSVHTDTPFPPEEPAGENPPDGAIINYYLSGRSSSPIKLEIIDAAGKLVRKFSSGDKPLAVDMTRVNPPDYWVRPFQPLKNEPGMQRFVWDLTYPNPPAERYDLPISAVYHDTPFVPQGPYVLPGRYTVRLTADGRSFTQSLDVRMDPRVTTPAAGLRQQFDLSMEAYNGIIASTQMMTEVNRANEEIRKNLAAASGNAERSKSLETLQQKVRELTGGPRSVPGSVAQSTPVDQMPLGRLAASFTSMLDLLQEVDATPTTQAVRDIGALRAALARAQGNWSALRSQLQAAGVNIASE